MDRVRVGTVSYVNAQPLTDALDPQAYAIVRDVPSAIARQLVEGSVDVALVPVAAVLDNPDLHVVPGWCVGADGPVHSVVIAAETEPEAWTELVLDGSSRTSVTLARLLIAEGPLKDRVRPDLVITDGPPGSGPVRVGGTVAAVVIGDPARALPASLMRWDLAALWKAWTGRPFVFAVWAAQEGLAQSVRDALRTAGAEGTAGIEARYTGDDLDYLRTFLRYPLDEPALIGLREFAARAHRAGLVRSDAVVLLDPVVRRRARRDLDTVLARAIDGVSPSAASLAALAADVPGADLHLAGLLRRQAMHGAAPFTWLYAVGADGGSAEAFAEGLRDAAPEASCVVIEAGLPSAVRAARAAAVRATGRDPLLDIASGHADPALVLAEGFDAVRLDAHTLTADRLAAWVASGIALEVALWLDHGDPAAALADLAALTAAGGVQAVSVHLSLPEGALVAPGSPTPAAYLRGVALARLALPNVPHVVASPRTQGLVLAQAALLAGACDLGPVGPGADPRALPAGVASFEADPVEAERVLRALGAEPVRRDLHWRVVGGPLTAPRKVRPVEVRDRSEIHVRDV